MTDAAPAAQSSPGEPAYAWGAAGPSWQIGMRVGGHDERQVDLYAAVRRTGTDTALPAGKLTLQTRGGGGITEDGSGPRRTGDLTLTTPVTEVAGWRVPAVPGESYRAVFTLPAGPTLTSDWVSAPAT